MNTAEVDSIPRQLYASLLGRLRILRVLVRGGERRERAWLYVAYSLHKGSKAYAAV